MSVYGDIIVGSKITNVKPPFNLWNAKSASQDLLWSRTSFLHPCSVFSYMAFIREEIVGGCFRVDWIDKLSTFPELQRK